MTYGDMKMMHGLMQVINCQVKALVKHGCTKADWHMLCILLTYDWPVALETLIMHLTDEGDTQLYSGDRPHEDEIWPCESEMRPRAVRFAVCSFCTNILTGPFNPFDNLKYDLRTCGAGTC